MKIIKIIFSRTIFLILGILSILVAIGFFMFGRTDKSIPFIIFFSVFGVALIAINVNKKFQDKRQNEDYVSFFVIGVIFLIIGLSSRNYSLWILGLIFFLIGLGGILGRKAKGRIKKEKIKK